MNNNCSFIDSCNQKFIISNLLYSLFNEAKILCFMLLKFKLLLLKIQYNTIQ
jgi:hypothetical protein